MSRYNYYCTADFECRGIIYLSGAKHIMGHLERQFRGQKSLCPLEKS
jgi:hypothetical protein